MNIYTQMQQSAEGIVPGVNLRSLLSADGRRLDRAEKAQIAKLLRSNQCYLSPSWLAYYYPVCKDRLVAIKQNLKIKTA